MPRKTYTPEQIIGKLRQIEVLIAQLSALVSPGLASALSDS